MGMAGSSIAGSSGWRVARRAFRQREGGFAGEPQAGIADGSGAHVAQRILQKPTWATVSQVKVERRWCIGWHFCVFAQLLTSGAPLSCPLA